MQLCNMEKIYNTKKENFLYIV